MKVFKRYLGVLVIFILIGQAFANEQQYPLKNHELYNALKKGYAEIDRLQESILQHHHNIEVNKEIKVIISEPEYEQELKKDKTAELKKKVMKELKISEKEARILLNKQDKRVLKIWNKMLEPSYQKFKKIAEKRVNEREYTNMSICMQMHDMLNERKIDSIRSQWRNEIAKQMKITLDEADILITNDDSRATEILEQMVAKDIKATYRNAKAKILNEITMAKQKNKIIKEKVDI